MYAATKPHVRECVSPGLIWGAFILVLLGVAGAGSWSLFHRRHPSPRPQQLPVYGTVPDFSLVERSAHPLARTDLAGKIWVADFVFTHCAGMCPLLSARMAGLQKSLRDTAVTLVSFSVDPERDTPEALRHYAAHYHADGKRWLFVTGGREALYQLIREGFRISVAALPPDDPRLAGEPIVHSDRFVLVDSNLQIRGYYHGTDEGSVAQLLRDVETLQREQRSWSRSLTSPASTPS